MVLLHKKTWRRYRSSDAFVFFVTYIFFVDSDDDKEDSPSDLKRVMRRPWNTYARTPRTITRSIAAPVVIPMTIGDSFDFFLEDDDGVEERVSEGVVEEEDEDVEGGAVTFVGMR